MSGESLPMPQPLPVLPVSDVEKQAVNDLSFDDRYSPALSQKVNASLRLTMIDGDVTSVESGRRRR